MVDSVLIHKFDLHTTSPSQRTREYPGRHLLAKNVSVKPAENRDGAGKFKSSPAH